MPWNHMKVTRCAHIILVAFFLVYPGWHQIKLEILSLRVSGEKCKFCVCVHVTIAFYASASHSPQETLCFWTVRTCICPRVIICWTFVSTISYKLFVCWDFTEFTTLVWLGTMMNGLHFEVKRSKVKVTVRPNALSWWRHTIVRDHTI